MYQDLARIAIQAALANNWDKAIEINLKILEENPSDTDALNRAAQAYVRRGRLADAIQAAEQVLTLDPLNSIAIKCVEKCKILYGRELNFVHNGVNKSLQQVFIEEPGKTKIVSLINICEPSLLAILNHGDKVDMSSGKKRVVISTIEDHYIGRLPDDLANRVIYLIGLGNQYDAYIKSVTTDDIRVFIRETHRSEDFSDKWSFPQRK